MAQVDDEGGDFRGSKCNESKEDSDQPKKPAVATIRGEVTLAGEKRKNEDGGVR